MNKEDIALKQLEITQYSDKIESTTDKETRQCSVCKKYVAIIPNYGNAMLFRPNLNRTHQLVTRLVRWYTKDTNIIICSSCCDTIKDSIEEGYTTFDYSRIVVQQTDLSKDEYLEIERLREIDEETVQTSTFKYWSETTDKPVPLDELSSIVNTVMKSLTSQDWVVLFNFSKWDGAFRFKLSDYEYTSNNIDFDRDKLDAEFVGEIIYVCLIMRGVHLNYKKITLDDTFIGTSEGIFDKAKMELRREYENHIR